MKLYPVRTHTHYGWYTGITNNGELVIVDVYQDLFFDSDGQFLRIHPYCDCDSYSSEKVEEFEARRRALIAIPCQIEIQPFDLPEYGLSLSQLPKRYEEYLTNPKAYSKDDRRFLKEWIDDELFEFRFNNDFWMDADGSLNSS